eukprot:6175535-Pleurochrysis_carterae.AAC.1
MKVHGVSICPPSQPRESSPPAQKQTSCAERGTITLALVPMHSRSDAASAPAKAQQQPQLDWSRMSPITRAHCGHLLAASNESGMVFGYAPSATPILRGTNWLMVPSLSAAWICAFQSPRTPQSGFEAPGGSDEKRGWGAACQRTPADERTVSICAALRPERSERMETLTERTHAARVIARGDAESGD